jgi:STAM-binding protein
MPPSTERPRSIAELAELGNPAGLYDPRKSIREHFHLINNMRDEGYEYKTSGDVENAFITLAKAASLILDKIPNHAEYSQLNPKQKGSLADVGVLASPHISHTYLLDPPIERPHISSNAGRAKAQD